MLDYTLSAEELATLRQAHSKMTEKRLGSVDVSPQP
jgi:hypothetical protein